MAVSVKEKRSYDRRAELPTLELGIIFFTRQLLWWQHCKLISKCTSSTLKNKTRLFVQFSVASSSRKNFPCLDSNINITFLPSVLVLAFHCVSIYFLFFIGENLSRRTAPAWQGHQKGKLKPRLSHASTRHVLEIPCWL